MNMQILVNLPARDLKRSEAFFGGLGCTFDPPFTNEPVRMDSTQTPPH